MDVMKPWIAKRITELLGFEDDIVVECGSLGPRASLGLKAGSKLDQRTDLFRAHGAEL